jgi:hypothetical protein
LAVRFIDAVNRTDVWMVERRKDLGFATKTREPFSVCGECCWEDLQRDVASELRVFRAIHFAHPAAANQRQDFVRAEASPRSKGHDGYESARL